MPEEPPESSPSRPGTVNVTYGGLAADISLAKDYLPAAFAKYLLDANAWALQQSGTAPVMTAPLLAPGAKLRVAGAVLGRLLKQTVLQDVGGRKKLDRDRIKYLLDPDYRREIIRGETSEPAPLRLVLIKSEIRIACAEVLRELFELGTFSRADNTSDVDLMVKDSGFRDAMLDFIDESLARLHDNIFLDSPSKKRSLDTALIGTLSRRRRIDVDQGRLHGDDLIQELLYPLAQAAAVKRWIETGEAYLAPRAIHDRLDKDEPSAIEQLRVVTAEFVRTLLKDESTASRMYDPGSEQASLWHLSNNMIGRACSKEGKPGTTDAYGAVEAQDGSYSRQIRFLNGDLSPLEDIHLVKVLQNDVRQTTPTHWKMLEEEVNLLLRRLIAPAMGTPVGRTLIYARMRSTAAGEIERWLCGEISAPDGRIAILAKLYEGMARTVLGEVKLILARNLGVSSTDQLIDIKEGES